MVRVACGLRGFAACGLRGLWPVARVAYGLRPVACVACGLWRAWSVARVACGLWPVARAQNKKAARQCRAAL